MSPIPLLVLCRFLLLATEGSELTLAPDDYVYKLSIEDLLNTTVTTATKISERLENAPGSITVITRQEIADMNARSMRDIINVLVPSFDVVPLDFAYGDRTNEGVFARGVRNDIIQNVLILWNGQTKFNESTWGGSFTIADQSPENIERIEISRSPIPNYGGTGITIINITTREQSMEGFEAQVRVSANERTNFKNEGVQAKKFTAIWGQTVSDWHVGGSVQYYDDFGQEQRNRAGRGDYAYPSRTLRNGTWFAPNFTLSARTTDNSFSIQTWYKYTRQHSFLSGLVPSQSTDLYAWWSPVWMTQVAYQPVQELTLHLGSTFSGWSVVNDFGSPTGGGHNNLDLYAEGIYRKQLKSIMGHHEIISGVKIEREGQYDTWIYTWDGRALLEDRDPTKIWAANQARVVSSLYAEDIWKLTADLSITAGARGDYYWGYGDKRELAINPRTAVVYNLGANWVLKGLYASAIRPPAIYETAGHGVVPLLGNRHVRSEKIHTMELSAIYKQAAFKVQVTPFYSILTHRIAYETNAAGANEAQNTGTTQVTGVELELRYYADLRNYLFANGSWLHSYETDKHQMTRFIPQYYLNGGVNLNYDKFNGNLTLHYRSTRPLPGDLVVNQKHNKPILAPNVSISYEMLETLRAYLSIENFIGRDNQVPLSFDKLLYPLAQRTYSLGLISRF